jgi:type I restriction enzyme S subunit
LDSLYNIARGGSPRPIKDFITEDPDGINWVKIGDATASNKYIYETKQKIKPEGIQRSRLVNKGDFILSNSMSFGRPYIMATSGCIHDGWLVLSAKDDQIDQDFLYHMLGSPFVFNQFDSLAAGSTVRNLNKDLVSGVKIPLLPISEQKRIVALLDTVFADLEQTRVKTEQNLKNARELFDSYLQQICIGNEKDWIKCQIGDVCDLWQGLAINKKTKHLLVERSSLPLLRIKDLKYNTTEKYVAEEGFPAKALVNEDEVIYTRTGQVGLVFRGFKGVLHNNSFKVSPNDQIEKNYLFWWLQHSSFKSEIMKLSSKAAQPDISHTSFKKQPISIPPVSYQLNAVILIEKMNQLSLEVEAIYKKKLEAIDELKKSILQKAFSGELTEKAK